MCSGCALTEKNIFKAVNLLCIKAHHTIIFFYKISVLFLIPKKCFIP